MPKPTKAKGRPVIGNVQNTQYNQNTHDDPIIKVETGEPMTMRSKGFDFVITDTDVTIFSVKHKTIVFSITETEITIGNPEKEHCKFTF